MGQGLSLADLHKLKLTTSELCVCGEPLHIVNLCPHNRHNWWPTKASSGRRGLSQMATKALKK